MNSTKIALRNIAGPAAAANLHLAATLPDFTMLEHVDDCVSEDVRDEDHVVVDGFFPLPQGPGQGVTMNKLVIDTTAAREGIIWDV